MQAPGHLLTVAATFHRGTADAGEYKTFSLLSDAALGQEVKLSAMLQEYDQAKAENSNWQGPEVQTLEKTRTRLMTFSRYATLASGIWNV